MFIFQYKIQKIEHASEVLENGERKIPDRMTLEKARPMTWALTATLRPDCKDDNEFLSLWSGNAPAELFLKEFKKVISLKNSSLWRTMTPLPDFFIYRYEKRKSELLPELRAQAEKLFDPRGQKADFEDDYLVTCAQAVASWSLLKDTPFGEFKNLFKALTIFGAPVRELLEAEQVAKFFKAESAGTWEEIEQLITPSSYEQLKKTHLADYPIACTFSAYIAYYNRCGLDYDPQEMDKQLRLHMKFVETTLIDASTEVITVQNNEQQFDQAAKIQQFASKIGVPPQFNTYMKYADDKNDFLKQVYEKISISEKNLFVTISGHGAPDRVAMKSMGEEPGMKNEDLFKALKTWALTNKGKNMRCTLLINACYANDFSVKLLKMWKNDPELAGIAPPIMIPLAGKGMLSGDADKMFPAFPIIYDDLGKPEVIKGDFFLKYLDRFGVYEHHRGKSNSDPGIFFYDEDLTPMEIAAHEKSDWNGHRDWVYSKA